MIPSFIKKVTRSFLPALTRRYLRSTRWYTFKNIRIKVHPGVFHPGFFFSTKTLVRCLEEEQLKGVRILELGAGTGLLSIYCARQEAVVTASDISQEALQNLAENKALTGTEFTIVKSDIFDALTPDDYDLIVINPPYYPRTPTNDAEMAWFCGNDFQYFKKLFSQLQEKQKKSNRIMMILSEDCNIEKIVSLAKACSYIPDPVKEITNFWEKNYILCWNRVTR